MVGLCRPGGVFCVGGGRRLARKRLWRPISIGVEAFGRWSACADREGVFCVGGGRRLARSADPGEGGQAIQVFVPGFADGFCLL
jgi:hypothetical protein